MKTIDNVKWYQDKEATGEPGIWNSYVAGLAGAAERQAVSILKSILSG